MNEGYRYKRPYCFSTLYDQFRMLRTSLNGPGIHYYPSPFSPLHTLGCGVSCGDTCVLIFARPFCPSVVCIFRNIRLRVRVYSVRIYCIVLVTFSENTLPPAYLMEISFIISLALRGWLATNNGKLSPLQSTIEKKRNPRI